MMIVRRRYLLSYVALFFVLVLLGGCDEAEDSQATEESEVSEEVEAEEASVPEPAVEDSAGDNAEEEVEPTEAEAALERVEEELSQVSDADKEAILQRAEEALSADEGSTERRLVLNEFDKLEAWLILSSELVDGVTLLTLEDTPIGFDGAVLIARRQAFSELTSLIITHGDIGNKGAAVLAQSENMEDVISLSLTGNGIGDDGAIALSESDFLGNLQRLYLKENEIGDDGAIALVRSDNYPEIGLLLLSENPIGWPGIHVIEEEAEHLTTHIFDLRRKQMAQTFEEIREKVDSGEFERLSEDGSDWSEEPPEASPIEETDSCPTTGHFQAVLKMAGRPVLIVKPLQGNAPVPLRIDEETGRDLGIEDNDDPVWIFSREDGAPCRLEPGAPVIVEGPSEFRETPRLGVELHGTCELNSARDRHSDAPAHLAIRAPHVPDDCRMEVASLPDDRREDSGLSLPEEIVDLRNSLGESEELACDEEADDGCELHWRYQKATLDDGRQLFIAEVVEVHDWPDSDQYNCGSNVQNEWSSGVVIEADGTFHKLADEAWPTIVRLTDGEESEGLFGFTDKEYEVITRTVAADGSPGEATSFEWAERHVEVPSSAAGLAIEFACMP